MGTTALGTYAPGDKHRYHFTVALDGTAGNAYQGDTVDRGHSTSTPRRPEPNGTRGRQPWRAHG